jgi:UDP-glucuronate 4-epimerase
MMKKILVTGAAGFIGAAYAKRLCEAGFDVLGIDNLNDYYEVSLKEARLGTLEGFGNFEFRKVEMADREVMADLFADWKPAIVVNLAAQAGVRYSIDHPHAYVDSNLQGFLNVLEGCRHNGVEHLIFASSSSVYGANTTVPFSVQHNVDHPISLYAATKKSNELIAHSYAHLYGLPCTGLRFFTVYGPWGRPDMAVYGFTKRVAQGQAIDVYNHGDMMRDFTYIDDIVEAMLRLIERAPTKNAQWDSAQPDPSFSSAPYRLYNIGNNNPEKLMDMIGFIEAEFEMSAEKNFMEMQPGDVYATYADVAALEQEIGFKPATSLREGIGKFVQWYRDDHGAV